MYSQYGEDDVIIDLFGLYVGRFLDIGANDGQYLSNTLALVERGWSGVLVEANPLTFARLYERHGKNPKLTLINVAVGLRWKLTKFWPATKDDGLSTTELDHRQRREAEGLFGEPFYIGMVHVGDILIQLPTPIDFLSIDTEGTSAELFLNFPFGLNLPRVVCVEHDGRVQECVDHAALWGYRLVSQNAANLIFELRT